MPPHTLSKSSFLKFEQCPKAFYFYKKLPYLKDPFTAERQLTLQRGHDVGYFARQLFPGGVDIDAASESQEGALSLTAQHISAGTPVLYEATFMYNEVLVKVDILNLENGRYYAYEVKSSLRVSEVFMKDGCLQYYVLKNVLPYFEDLLLVTLDSAYIKEGEVNCRKLFKKRSLREKAEANLEYFDLQVKGALLVIEENKTPNIPVGPQCFRPYQCDYFGICWKENLHDRSVFNMPGTSRDTQFGWHRAGIRLIDQVPDEMLEKESLLRIKNAFTLNEPFYDIKAIERFCSRIRFPVAAMDMEVWNPAIPVIDGTRPFEQIPFLAGFSNGDHDTYFLTSHMNDDRRNFAEALLALSEGFKTILVYDRNLELAVINSLSERFPDLAPGFSVLTGKIVDVFDVFLHMHYYHPGFKNSFSLKVTSAVLLGDMQYGTIGSGLEAMALFDNYRLEKNEIAKQLLHDDLVHYCLTDCRATLALYRFLESLRKR